MSKIEYAILVFVIMLLSSCSTRTVKTYYPPDDKCAIPIVDEEGNTIGIHGALQGKAEIHEFTIGTKGLGDYKFLTISGLNF